MLSTDKKTAFICFTENGCTLAMRMSKHFQQAYLLKKGAFENTDFKTIPDVKKYVSNHFRDYQQWVFIGALGICVRAIGKCLTNKKNDPAVVNIDQQGRFVQSVVGGHQGANDLANYIAQKTGATAVISTSSDLQNIWNLDELSEKFGWSTHTNTPFQILQGIFIARKPTVLILRVNDQHTNWLRSTAPNFVTIAETSENIHWQHYKLALYVGYEKLNAPIPTLAFYPPCLSLGSGCSKNIPPDFFEKELLKNLNEKNIAPQALADLNTIDIKKDEKAYQNFRKKYGIDFHCYEKEKLQSVKVPNPSAVVQKKIGVNSVAESAAAMGTGQEKWLITKQKITHHKGKFTYALSLKKHYVKQPFIWVVGAGSGDPELLTLKGKKLLSKADYVLYAGSLVPEKILQYIRAGIPIENSATMTLETQIKKMTAHYNAGKIIVRLHSGDPAIYGAVQEQLSIFDEMGFDYAVVPGISAFQAAAAYLKSELTIPKQTQTIVLTRGNGKTPMPPREELHKIATLQASMCIYLSAGIAQKVTRELLTHYPATTPTAVVYRIGWDDEKVWETTLENFAGIIKKNKLKRTVLIMVGEAIGARKHRSKLYDGNWQHIFRKRSKN